VNSNKYNDLKSLDLGEFDYSRGYLKIRKDGKWGLMDVCSDNLLINCNYDQIINYYNSDDWTKPFIYKGLVIVSNENKFGIITVKGETVLDCIYNKIYYEQEVKPGFFKVELNEEIIEIRNKYR
jgi:hypothetical protein